MAEQRRSNLSVCGLLPNSRGGAWLGPGGGGAVGFDSDFPGPLPGGPCPAPGLVLLVRDSESGSVRAQHGRRGGPSQLGSEAQRFGMAPGAGTAQQPKCQAASSELPGPHQLGAARPAPEFSCPRAAARRMRLTRQASRTRGGAVPVSSACAYAAAVVSQRAVGCQQHGEIATGVSAAR